MLGAAIYYTTEVGLWSDSKKTEQLYGDLYKTIAPYVKEVPVEVILFAATFTQLTFVARKTLFFSVCTSIISYVKP